MNATIWAPGGTIPVSANADNTILTQRFVATAGQSLFTLSRFAYQVGSNSLAVYVNSAYQHLSDDFSETSNTSFTITGGCKAGDVVVAVGLIGSTAAQAAAVSASQAATSAAEAAASYAAILALSLPNLPLTIANGGTNAATKTTGFNNLSPLTTKGDLLGFNGTDNIRLASSGINGQSLVQDSTQASGLKWAFTGIAVVASTVTTNTNASITPSIYPCNTTALGNCITAPDARNLAVGMFAVIDNEAGGYPVGWRDSTGVLAGKNVVNAGGFGFVWLEDNSTAAGTWRISGTNLSPGLIKSNTTLSSTYTSTVHAPYAALDTRNSIHFATIASNGFAAFVVDDAGNTVTTPVAVSTTANMVPRIAFTIDANNAIVFFDAGGSPGKAVVLTLSGTPGNYTLTVNSIASSVSIGWQVETSKDVPKIAQLSSTLYVFSTCDISGANPTFVVAISVSGTTVTIGTAANIITTNSIAFSTTTYALTATTALVLFLDSSGANTLKAVVISVSGTTCTVNSIATVASGISASLPTFSCLLSATKAIVADDNGSSTSVLVRALTIAGTAISVGSSLSIETGITPTSDIVSYSLTSATRFNPHLWRIGNNTAGLWYFDSNGYSRVVVLSESAGTLTKGGILYNSISIGTLSATFAGTMGQQGTSDFIALQQYGSSPCWKKYALPHKISGTTITQGVANTKIDLNLGDLVAANIIMRLSSGDYAVFDARTAAMSVLRTNGDIINYRGSIELAAAGTAALSWPIAIVGNRTVFVFKTLTSTVDAANTYQLGIISTEIAQ